jgi:hypothetical protein
MKTKTIQPMMQSFLLCGVLAATALVHPAAAAETKSSPNTAVIYWQAFAALPPKPEGDDKAKTEEWLGQSEYAMKLLQKASSLQSCDWELDYDQGLDLQAPHVSKMLNLTKAAIAHAKHIAQSDNKRAHAELQAVIRAARHLGTDHYLIMQLARASIEMKALEVLESELPKTTEEIRKSWIAALDSLPKPPTLAQLIETEHQGALVTLKKLTTEEGRKTLGKEIEQALGAANSKSLSSAQLQALIDQVDVDYKELKGIAEGSAAKIAESSDAFIKKMEKDKSRHALSLMVVPAVTTIAEKLQRTEDKLAEIRKQLEAK